MTLLQVSGLHVSFPSEEGPVAAVRGIAFTLERGQAVGIVGESGSGKSVTALALMGLLPDQARVSGSVRLNGQELIGLGDREMSKLRGKSISMVFQDPLSALTPVYRIGDQISEALLVHDRAITRRTATERAVELLELVGISDAAGRSRAFPHEFSGGMRQRVGIAMAIANDPALIICDEPTTALDVTVQAQILRLLNTAQELTGAAVLMITHDLAVASTVADQISVMYAGKIVETGSATELFQTPRMPYTVGLVGSIPRFDAPPRTDLLPIAGAPALLNALPDGCPFHPRCPVALDACSAAEPELVAVAPGHLAACVRANELSTQDEAAAFRSGGFDAPAAADLARKVVLRTSGLTKTYSPARGLRLGRRPGPVPAAVDVDLVLNRGQTLALVGESGSGKSTVVSEIMNLVAPQRGSLIVFGRDAATLSARDRRAIRSRIQVVFQDPAASLDPRMPVRDLIAEPLRIQRVKNDQIAARVDELLTLVGLRETLADRYPSDLSGGQKQRVCIARALALEPEILVLDEPVSSLDVSVQAGVLNLLRGLQKRLGLAYLFVTHDLSVVRNMAHDVAVMYRGRIVEQAAADDLFARPQHEYTQALLAAVPQMPASRSRE